MTPTPVRQPTTPRSTTSPPAPLSVSQQAALAAERLHHAVVQPLFLAIEAEPGSVDNNRLEQALATLVDQHDILRTVYPTDRRTPYQQIQTVDYETVSAPENADPFEDALHIFDVAQGPALRVKVHHIDDHDVVTVAAHPVLADDETLELLVRELWAIYEGAQPNEASQYAPYALKQIKALTSRNKDDDDLAYWRGQLSALPQRKPLTSGLSLQEECTPGETVRRTREEITVAGTSLHEPGVIELLLSRTLSALGLGQDILLGVVVADDARPDTGVALGNYANYHIVRIALTPETEQGNADNSRQAVAQTREAARAHGSLRGEWLLHQMHITGQVPFQALVRIHPQTTAFSASHAQLRLLHRHGARPFGVDVVVDAEFTAEGVHLSVEYPSALVGNPVLSQITHYLRDQLEGWVTDPDSVHRAPIPETLRVFAPAVEWDMYATGIGGEPQTDAERVVAEVMREVLELEESDPVGREDTFFALGGDSVSALKAVTMLQGRGYTLDVQKVFESPTLCELAELLEKTEGQQTPSPSPVAPMSASGLDAAALASLGKKFTQR